jgi:hypothetical protein
LGNKNTMTPVTPVAFLDFIPDWCKDGVSKASNVGLVVGYPDKTFQAGRSISIAEAATVMHRWKYLIDTGVINAPAIPLPPPQPVVVPNEPGAIPAAPPQPAVVPNEPGTIPAAPVQPPVNPNEPGEIPPAPVQPPVNPNGPGEVPPPPAQQ